LGHLSTPQSVRNHRRRCTRERKGKTRLSLPAGATCASSRRSLSCDSRPFIWPFGRRAKVDMARSPSRKRMAANCAKRKCKVFKKRGAQHVRIKGQAVDLSPTMRRHRGTEDWRVVSTPFQFSSRSGRQRGDRGQSCCRFFCARLASAEGRGSVGGDYTSRKGSSAASPPDCD
jgi:hypothetical protein